MVGVGREWELGQDGGGQFCNNGLVILYGKIVLLFQNRCKNMFKVVLVLRQLTVRLKECEVELVLRRNNESIPLCSRLPLLNGLCLINHVKELYLHEDEKLCLRVYISQPNEKKFGGEVVINVFQWEQNVIHATESRLVNSPDNHSCLKYNFYYFRELGVNDGQAFLEAKQKREREYSLIESFNEQLSQEKQKLEEEAYSWHKKNEQLETGRKTMINSIHERENHMKTLRMEDEKEKRERLEEEH